MTFAMAIKLAPFALIALLFTGLLWFRGDSIKYKANAEASAAQATQLEKVNLADQQAMQRQSDAIKANTDIQLALSTALASNGKREDTTHQRIKDAIRNEPATKALADMPLPASVRAALNGAPQAAASPR